MIRRGADYRLASPATDVLLRFGAKAGGLGFAALLADNPFAKSLVAPEHFPQELALHCTKEDAQLASVLPEVYC